MSNPLGNWIDLSAVSNLYIQTYVKGFVDMSGGNLILRNNNIYVNSGDLSLGGRLLTIGDASLGENLYVGKKLTVNGDISTNGNVAIYGNLMVQQLQNTNIINTSVNNYQLVVTEDISLNGRLLVRNDASFGGNLIMIGSGTTGRLGIGKSNPAFPLDISGSMNVSNPSTTATYNNFYGKCAPTTTFPSTISPNTMSATSTTWANNNVTWTATASTQQTSSYFAFDTVIANKWVGASAYTNGTGIYNGYVTTTNINGITGTTSLSGDWLQIQSSIPLVMNTYNIAACDVATRSPAVYYILGSNDGNTWYALQSATIASNPYANNSYLGTNFTLASAGTQNSYTITNYSYNATAFTNFRMVITKVFTVNDNISIGEWLINFRLPTVTGPSNAIMYMDASNINQLDVSGSLGLFDSNPNMTVTPCIDSPSTYYWTNNNVLWTASGSSFQTSYPPYLAFRAPSSFVGSTTAVPFVTAVAGYSATAGTYTAAAYSTNVVGSSAIAGEWLQIQSSQPVYLNGYTIGTQYAGHADLPGSYTILGSNDGSSWYTMHTTTGFTAWPGNLPSGNATTYPVSQVTAFYPVFGASTGTINKNQITQGAYQTNAYTYFRFVIKTIIGTNNFGTTGGNGCARAFWSPVFEPVTSSVSLALDSGKPNQLNVGGAMSIAGPISLNYLALPSFTENQIGYQLVTYAPTAIASTATNTYSYSSAIPIAVGVWFIQVTYNASSLGNGELSLGFNTSTAVSQYASSGFNGASNQSVFLNATGILQISASTPNLYVFWCSGGSGLTCNWQMTRTRIA